VPSSTTPFSLEGWEPHAVDAVEPALGRVSFRKIYEGDDLSGTAVATMLNCGQVAYTAMERVTGTLGGRKGSFVLVHGAGPESESSMGVIVAGSGTGELAGLTGRVEIHHGETGPALYLDYALPTGS
jgi:hypothetical protein